MRTVVLQIEFEEGEIVYLKTDQDQLARQVMGFRLQNSNTIMFDLMCGTIHSVHYAMELTREKQIVNAL